MRRPRPSYEMVETALRQRLEAMLVDGLDEKKGVDEKGIRDLSEIIVGVFLQAHFAHHDLEPIRNVTEVAFSKCLRWYECRNDKDEEDEDED